MVMYDTITGGFYNKYDPVYGDDICCVSSNKTYKTYDTSTKPVKIRLDGYTYSIYNGLPEIKKVIFNNPATIVFWEDKVKTVVKCVDEPFDKEKGLAMAICKRLLGTNKSKSNFNKIFNKLISEAEEN